MLSKSVREYAREATQSNAYQRLISYLCYLDVLTALPERFNIWVFTRPGRGVAQVKDARNRAP